MVALWATLVYNGGSRYYWSERMFFRNKTIALNDEAKFTLKIGHDRNGILIIKELSVKANNVDELIEKTKETLEEFNRMKLEVIKGEMTAWIVIVIIWLFLTVKVTIMVSMWNSRLNNNVPIVEKSGFGGIRGEITLFVLWTICQMEPISWNYEM